MVNIYDLSNCPLSFKNGSYGGMAGHKDGIVFEGENWLVKYPRNLRELQGKGIASYSTAPLSEFLGSHIYQILGFDVHETILGVKHDKLVVACKDFTSNDNMQDSLLLEIRTIKNHASEELVDLLEQSPMSSTDTHIVDIDELLLHIRQNPVLVEIPNLEQHFFEQAIVDIFINNNDRNNGNWGILRSRNQPDRIAPVYDNGGSFLTKVSEEKVKNLLKNPNFEENTMNVLTAYGKSGHQYPAREFLDKMKDEPCFQKALCRVFLLIEQNMEQIASLVCSIPKACMTKNGVIDICSDARKELYMKQLQVRYERVLRPAYELVLQNKHKVEKRLEEADVTNDVVCGYDELEWKR